MKRRIERIDHPALAAVPERAVSCARADRCLVSSIPTDRERVAVVLQGAALLSHLGRGGWTLRGDWQGAFRDEGGMLRGLVAEPGAGTEHAGSRRRTVDHRLLRELLRRLFRTSGGIAGRGAGRAAARRILAIWDQDLRPVAADEAVGQILTEAEFLWSDHFARQRDSLVATVVRHDGSTACWTAGPGWVGRRLLRERSYGPGPDRTTGPDPWSEAGSGLVRESSASGAARRSTGAAAEVGQAPPPGGWSRAARHWLRRPELADRDRMSAVRALHAVGRFDSALKLLERDDSAAGEARRIVSLYRLGRLGAAENRLRAFDPRRLVRSERFELAEVALRVLANRGRAESGEAWLRRADLERADPEGNPAGEREALACDLLWAASAWDRGDHEAMKAALDSAAGARRMPELAWRWYHLRGLQNLASGAREEALRNLASALSSSRRSLRPIDAAALWNDMMLCRAALDDLSGAERACLHGIRLLRDAEGDGQATLFLFNLAELRLRRGVTEGVEEIVRRAALANRNSGNDRGRAHDAALWARLELLRGQPGTALARIREGTAERAGWNSAELRVLAARALGWLGRTEDARRELVDVDPEPVLDAEEIPALWWHAGDRERAAATGAALPIWQVVFAGDRPDPSAALGEGLELLPEHRAARLVYDLERLVPGAVSGPWLLRSAATLRRHGARRFATGLEVAAGGPWSALERYLTRIECDGPEAADAALVDLCRSVGCGSLQVARDADGGDRVLLAGSARRSPDPATPAGEEGRPTTDRIGSRERVILQLARLSRRDHRDGAICGSRAGRGRGATGAGPEIVGDSTALRVALDRVDRLAATELPILIRGETGTGKELFARRAHARSARRAAPFLPVNCAALSETLLLSELFGHARGSFTGADRERVGVFEAAGDGTVFLDEIGDLPMQAQGALLRVLQEGEVRRLGENRPRRVRARVVAATHRDLESRASTGGFRADLFFRLHVGYVCLPPLRERDGDIVALAESFAPSRVLPLSDSVRRRLREHGWPGNVRELRNVVTAAAALLEPDERLTVRSLGLPEKTTEAAASSYHQQVDELKRRLVRDAVSLSDGNRARAAARLGISRQAMSYLVRKFQIEI